MTDTTVLSPAQQKAIMASLLPGEEVAWSGSESHTRYRLQRISRIGVFSAWIVLAGVLSGVMIRLTPNFVQSTVKEVLPIILLGGLAAAGGVLLAREVIFPAKTGPDAYAITNRRALVITSGRKDLCRSYPLETLASAWVRRGKNGSGDILLEHETGWGDDPAGRSTWQVKQVGFFGLTCVDEVYRQLEQLTAPDRVLVKRN
jgi:hypothetical protein